MVGLPEFFQQTSDEPYNRHDYKLVYINGQTKVFEESSKTSWQHGFNIQNNS
jgi:hypothetical protein